MKIKMSLIRTKCLSEKYYASIKYMAHTLRGEERREFIKKVCDINIYLGCLCTKTCEQDKQLDEYISKKINHYFEPRKVVFYDRGQKKRIVTERRLRSFDIANYLLACNVVGHTKAIHWYINTYPVQKSILIQLAKEMDEEQLIDLLMCLFRSKDNKDKLRGIGSAKNLLVMKKDPRVKKMLEGLWYSDKDAFVQLAYDTGWLGEIWKYSSKGYELYINILLNVNKLLLAMNLLEDSIVGECSLYSVLKSKRGKPFLYLYFLNKLDNGLKMTEREYDLVSKLEEPSEKIKNYFISFFIDVINGKYRSNIDYSKLYSSFKKVYSYAKNVKVSLGYTEYESLTEIIKGTKSENWRGIVELYMMTALSARVSFDEFFKKIVFYFAIEPKELIKELKKYPKWLKKVDDNYVFETLRTESYPDITNIGVSSNEVLGVISAYDEIRNVVSVTNFSGDSIALGNIH